MPDHGTIAKRLTVVDRRNCHQFRKIVNTAAQTLNPALRASLQALYVLPTSMVSSHNRYVPFSTDGFDSIALKSTEIILNWVNATAVEVVAIEVLLCLYGQLNVPTSPLATGHIEVPVPACVFLERATDR